MWTLVAMYHAVQTFSIRPNDGWWIHMFVIRDDFSETARTEAS